MKPPRRSYPARALFALPEPAVRTLLRGRSLVVDGEALDPRMELFAALAEAAGQSFRPDLTVEEMRRGYARMNLMFGLTPNRSVRARDLELPVAGATIHARFYRPAGTADRMLAAVVYYHGGGFVIGDVASYDALARFIAARGFAVLNVGYRRAPEHPVPTAHEDAYAAYLALRERAVDLGVDAACIAVAGDSAGGNLATNVAMRGRDAGVPPAFQWLIYPAVDARGSYRSKGLFDRGVPLTTQTVDWFSARMTASPAELGQPVLSPLRESLAGLAPAHVTIAGFDPLRDEDEAYVSALSAAGVAVTRDYRPTLAHGFVNVAGVVPEARDALETGVAAIHAALGP